MAKGKARAMESEQSDNINLSVQFTEAEVLALEQEAKRELLSITSLIRRKLFPPKA